MHELTVTIGVVKKQLKKLSSFKSMSTHTGEYILIVLTDDRSVVRKESPYIAYYIRTHADKQIMCIHIFFIQLFPQYRFVVVKP